MDKLIKALSGHKAILFTGAGFSSDMTNINNQNPRRAKELAKKICSLGDFPEDEDLRYASDRLIRQKGNKITELIEFLIQEYKIKKVEEHHKVICKLPWLRFYTTNYDKGIELSCDLVDKNVSSVDISCATTQEYLNRKNLCVHINGSIENLTPKSLNDNFKLSDSSYVSSETFTSSNWYRIFISDLERCSALIFIGYSLYDIDIEKILKENEIFKEKTFFIVGSGFKNEKQEYKLSKYGTVIKKDASYFAQYIESNSELFENDEDEHILSAFTKYENDENKDRFISDDEIKSFLLFGQYKSDYLEYSNQSLNSIARTAISKIEDFINKDQINTIVLLGELANGKTICCYQIAMNLSKKGHDVYLINNIYDEFRDDIDTLAQSRKDLILIIDNYTNHMEVVSYIHLVSHNNIKVILTSRPSAHDRQMMKTNFPFLQIELDHLNHNELDGFVKIFDNLGAWRDKAAYSPLNKIKQLEKDNGNQISLILMKLFDSPQIINRFDPIIKSLINSELKNIIFSICFLRILNIETTKRNIDDLAGDNLIYSNNMKFNKDFLDIFSNNRDVFEAKSSYFAIWLIKNYFTSDFSINYLISIADKFNAYRNSNFDIDKTIFYATLRFSFVERIISDKNKKSYLKSYYDRLKKKIPWLQSDPHFWMQYAMSMMMFEEYKQAQDYFVQSYALARAKVNYNTDSIDAQQARLHLKRGTIENDGAICYDFFQKAHFLLINLPNDNYKIKQVIGYVDFYNRSYNKLSKDNKKNFIKKCQDMVQNISKESNYSYSFLFRETKDKLEKIIEKS